MQPLAGKAGQMGELTLERTVEALLFVSDRALGAEEIAGVTGEPIAAVEQALQGLVDDYQGRGIRIIVHADKYQMSSAPEAAACCRRLLGLDSGQRLTQASLETLAIVAYRQPVTKAQTDRIRGVDSDSPLSLLLARGLVAPVGRADQVGRPTLYGTTPAFLAYFGIASLGDLPEADLPQLG